ncbi:MAG: ABC transporter ATP-binding protein, partial [Candidatus Nanohaloarchaea archaeon]
PLINLDPIIQDRFTGFLRDYNEAGNTVFLSTHVMQLAEELCDRVGIISRGRLIADRQVDELLSADGSLADAFITEVEDGDAAPGDG